MKLLFDENLSDRLTRALAAEFPGSLHVRQVELASADDQQVWDYARREDLTIVSKDSDFHQRSLLFGSPPKVVWIQVGNCSTSEIVDLLRQHQTDIETFEADPQTSFLVLSWLR